MREGPFASPTATNSKCLQAAQQEQQGLHSWEQQGHHNQEQLGLHMPGQQGLSSTIL